MSDDISPFPKRLPEFSRAVDDSEDSDWDDADAEAGAAWGSNCVLRLTPESLGEMAGGDAGAGTGRLDCSTLLVGVGPSACSFLSAFVLGDDAKIVGLLTCGYREGVANSLGQTARGDFACFLYRLACNPQVLVCPAMSAVPPADCHAFTESLLSVLNLESLDVAVFSTELLSSYQSAVPTSALPCPLLRCLRSSAMVSQGKASSPKGGAPAVPLLEPPNLLTGLSAQLLSVCQMRRIPAVAYVSYQQTSLPQPPAKPDLEAAASLKAALAFEPLRFCRPSWPRAADDVMRELCADSAGLLPGTLYI